MLEYTIQPWKKDEATARSMRSVMMRALPIAPSSPIDTVCNVYKKLTDEYPSGTWVAYDQNKVIAFIMLFKGPSNHVARVTGGVLPQYQQMGIGSKLWSTLLAELPRYPDLTHIQSRTFGSYTNSIKFIEKLTFKSIEKMIWLERSIDLPLSSFFKKKLERIPQSIQVMTAQNFKESRADWRHAWWSMEQEALHDIPTQIGVTQLTLKEWSDWQQSPLCNLDHILLAVDGIKPVGILKFGMIPNRSVNIELTVVAKSHRRMGISTLLKVYLINLAKTMNQTIISTQNHEANHAIRQANLNFGFTEQHIMIDYLYRVESSNTIELEDES